MREQLSTAVSILREGGVVAYPTDTVYGLGAAISHEEAVKRVYRIKGRPLTRPLSLLVADLDSLTRVARELTVVARRLAEKMLPGGLTLVVRRSSEIPPWVTSGGDTVAVRIPDHPVTLELIRRLGQPLIGTSANLSGRPSIRDVEGVRIQLGNLVDFILDGGVCPGGIESTVVDVTGERAIIIRAGAVAGEEIEKACGLPAEQG